MKLHINGINVAPVLGRLVLEKHREEAAATLTATLWAAAADAFFLHLSLAVGDVVQLTEEDGTVRFLGSIHALERSPERIRLTAFDRGIYLTRNEVAGVFAGSGEEICREVAAQLGIGVGTLEADPTYRVISALRGERAISILQQAAGKGREITVEGETLTVRRQRPVTFLLPTEQILEVSASADIRQMVNRCQVVDYRGRETAWAEETDQIAKYGAFLQVLGQNGTDPTLQAKEALAGRKMAAEVVLWGNAGYICGAYVRGEQPQWGLEGLYTITAVRHRWEAGLFTTELSLEGSP